MKNLASFPEAGENKAVVTPRISDVLAYESFGHTRQRDHIIASISPLKDRLGEELESKYASIVDDGQ